jgi:osmotically-inducible protein OsmY
MMAMEIRHSTDDVELERRIINYLHQRLPMLNEFEVETHAGRVVLRGTASSTIIRERCVDCCRSVAGVLDVVDRMAVSPTVNGASKKDF